MVWLDRRAGPMRATQRTRDRQGVVTHQLRLERNRGPRRQQNGFPDRERRDRPSRSTFCRGRAHNNRLVHGLHVPSVRTSSSASSRGARDERRSPCHTEFSAVFTVGAKWCCQIRLTTTRASAGSWATPPVSDRCRHEAQGVARDPARPSSSVPWLLASLLLSGWRRPRTPLTPRVVVNRIWQHICTGLGEDRRNFGVQGEPPSHPSSRLAGREHGADRWT